MTPQAMRWENRLLTWPPRRPSGVQVLMGLTVLLVLASLYAAGQGAYGLGWQELIQLMTGELEGTPEGEASALVFNNIRLPRLLLAVTAGAALAMAGALMQGLFRNPLADPGLIGVSSGAALAAGITIVMGALWWP
jgi:iron complex transport system permease protein